MFSGEHAVLRGCSALVAAADYRVTARARLRHDDVIRVVSDLGTCEMRVGAIGADRPFQFAAAAIAAADGDKLSSGFDLCLDAAMPPDVGLGSSAAVSVAVYAAVMALQDGAIPRKAALWRTCRDMIRTVQGRGSGADVAASVYGGVLLYQQDEGVCEQYLDHLPDISLFYVGYKTSTARVIDILEKKRLREKKVFQELDHRMEAATQLAADALRRSDLSALGRALEEGQAVLCGYGVCDPNMHNLTACLRKDAGISAAKISGSGLGDCVLGLGTITEPDRIPYKWIPVSIDRKGIVVEWK